MGCAHSTKSRGDADLDQARHSAVGGPPRPQSQAVSKEATTDELIAADEARLAEAIKKKLPKGSRWHEFGGAELEPLLAFTDIIDAAWLLKLLDGEVMPECKGVVPPWQLVPPEAKLSLETLRCTTIDGKLPVAVLSYGWEGRRHPDPNGALLRRLRPVLEAMVHSCEHGAERKPSDIRAKERKPAAWGIVWDFMSLPQRGYTTRYVDDERDADGKLIRSHDDRTPYQLARFGKGLKGINVWYGAQFTTTLVCDFEMSAGAENSAPIDKRGWCIFERRLSSVRKHGDCCLTLSQMPQGGEVLYWGDVTDACKANRLPPQLPDAFEAMMCEGMAREQAAAGTGIRFTNGKDATDICIPQYREAFERLMSAGGVIGFEACAWADADVEQLAASLRYAHDVGATSQAEGLFLASNRLTDAALPPLVKAIEAGEMPCLKHLSLSYNELTDAGLATLRPLLAGRLSGLELLSFGARLTADGARSLAALLADGHLAGLHCLELDGNRGLGDAGVEAMAEALAAGRLPALKNLELAGTGMGYAGAAALAKALGGAPALEMLGVGGNAIVATAKEELKAACAARGVRAEFWVPEA